MSETVHVGGKSLRLLRGDLTDLDIEAFVFYATEDLALGSGFGTAVSMRGGPSIQEELKTLAPAEPTEAVISGAGELKATYIIHAVGPKFQEADTPRLLRQTMDNALTAADAKNIKKLAFPPMGTGFYGVGLELCAEVMIDRIAHHLGKDTSLEEVIICVGDNREFLPFAKRLTQYHSTVKEAS
jgi:O-acetyl-ADP-ribose deacetylase (regulator of RNase III)